MEIGGFLKMSLIDFPGKIAAVIFTRGCNLRCSYCHNPELVEPKQYSDLIAERDVLDFLAKRLGKLEGVVITGGEPTIQPDLPQFIQAVRRLGYAVK
ncbi:MAG: radical SAM protein, partial [Candidatus Omnitrophica bacterium]|nr:radical SAM protein [Candidatus Omnitrophota bacterium]